MPTKNSLYTPTPIVSAQSMSANFTSKVVSVQFLDNIMIQIIATGAPAGTFAVQGSNDYDINSNVSGANWVNLPLSGVPTLTGSPDSIDIQMTQLASPYIRIVYTFTSGSGTCNIWVAGKAV